MKTVRLLELEQPTPANMLQVQLDPEAIAVDLDATVTWTAGRIFWNEDMLVCLGRVNTNCAPFFRNLEAHIVDSFKSAVLTYSESGQISANTLTIILSCLRTASKQHPTKIIDAGWVSRSLQSGSFPRSRYPIRLFLEYWRDGYPNIVTEGALNLLAQADISLTYSRNVESDDPEKSWLNDEEYDALLVATWKHYDVNGTTQDTLIRLLSLQYARRPGQLSSLKFGDLKPRSSEKNHSNEVHFPSVKERNVETEFRGGKFEAHVVAEHLWDLFKIQRTEIKSLFEKSLNLNLKEVDIDKLPVFTTKRRVLEGVRILRDKLGLVPEDHLGDQVFHIVPMTIGMVISFKTNMLMGSERNKYSAPPDLPISNRTGKPLVLYAIRLRHTRARQLARLGVPKSILSVWLGHSSDDSIDSYYDDPAELARTIDEYMSPTLTPIALAFHGRIIATDADATHPNDPLKSLELAKDGILHHMGKCGKFSFCSTTSVPIPCYRCRSFEPLVDAPHEEVLEALLYRQDQEQSVVKAGSMRKLLIPIDLSPDIRAVERCIALCKAKREKT